MSQRKGSITPKTIRKKFSEVATAEEAADIRRYDHEISADDTLEPEKRVLSHLFWKNHQFHKNAYFGYYAAISKAKFSNVDRLSFAPSI